MTQLSAALLVFLALFGDRSLEVFLASAPASSLPSALTARASKPDAGDEDDKDDDEESEEDFRPAG